MWDILNTINAASVIGMLVGVILYYVAIRVSRRDVVLLITNLWSVWLGKGIPAQPSKPTPPAPLEDVIPAHLIPKHEIEFMRIMSTGMSVGFIFIDNTQTIRVFNPTAEDIFGYSSEEVIGADLSLLMPPPDADRHHFYIDQYREQRNYKRVSRTVGKTRPVMIKKSDGKTELVMLSITDVQNGISGFVGLIWRQDVHPVQTVAVVPVVPRQEAIIPMNSNAKELVRPARPEPLLNFSATTRREIAALAVSQETVKLRSENCELNRGALVRTN